MDHADCLCSHARYTHRQGVAGCKGDGCPCDGYQQPDAAGELVDQLDRALADLAQARTDLQQARADLKVERAAHLATRCERDELRIDLSAAQLDRDTLASEIRRAITDVQAVL